MKPAIPAILLTLSSVFAFPAYAADELRGETFCFPAKDVPKLIDELSEIKDERRDVVDVRLKSRFIIKDGGVWPDRFYLMKDGELVTDLPFSRETGAVPTFIDATLERPDTDICVDDPTRAERPADDEGLYFEMGLSPLFHNESGRYDFAELKEGAKDGKKFYKKMLPSAVALLMPDTDYFGIKMKANEVQPTVWALTEEGQAPLSLETVNDMWIVSLDDLEDLDATGMVVGGGDYTLQPVPSPKTLRRFGWGDATGEE